MVFGVTIMTYEDFSAPNYTEVDPNGDIVIAPNTKITYTTMIRNVSAYVVKDFGANHFSGDFEFLLEAEINPLADNAGATIIALENGSASHDLSNLLGENDYIALWWQRSDPTALVAKLRISVGGSNVTDTTSLVVAGTKYYITFKRVTNTVYAKFYTGSHGGTHVDTIAVGRTSAPDFRYLYACQSITSASSPNNSASGVNENYDLQEVELELVIDGGIVPILRVLNIT